MVNGPRPTTIAVAAVTTRPAPSTPTLLTRQHTSIYSNASGTTPVLVYGKDITPLQGTWADEPWSPSERVHAEPVTMRGILEAPISAEPSAIEDDNSSTSGETAVFDASRVAHVESMDMLRTASHGSSTSNARTATTAGHLSFVFRYDPYSTQTRTEMYRCNCDDCLDRASAVNGVDFLVAPMYEHTPTYQQYEDTTSMGHRMSSYESYEPSPQYANEEAMWHDAPVVPAIQPTSFMPPPPPPRITRRVIAESAEPSLDAESAFYLIIMRWYNKASAAHGWVKEDDLCPAPDFGEKYTFDEWVDEIGRWWLRNFEHVQVKTSASSGAMRAAAVVPRPRPTGFETHATAAAASTLPVPRRMAGNSGLTAEMLDSHNQVVAPTAHVARPRRELPW